MSMSDKKNLLADLPAEDATDEKGNPLLFAVDGDEMFPFSVDAKTNQVHTNAHDVSLLNLIANWLTLLPPQAPFPPPPHILQKQLTENIQEAKEKGNTAFRQKDYETAIKHYTLGVAMITSRPMWESCSLIADELTVMLANRSAAMYACEAYIEALCDADAVVKIKGAWGKGHFRKGKALAALQRYDEARAALDLGHQCEPDNEVCTTQPRHTHRQTDSVCRTFSRPLPSCRRSSMYNHDAFPHTVTSCRL